MISIRSLLARSTALAVPALALTLSLGSAPAFAAAAAPGHAARTASVPAGVTFHSLTLLNGWVSSQGQFGTGSPRVGAANGVVYLAGSLHQPSGSNGHFATLPAGYRPSHWLYLPVYSYAGAQGSLEITPAGKMYLFGGDTTGYSSLAGISFPRTLASQPLSLLNGWQSAQPIYTTGDPAVTVSHGVAYLSGSLEQPSPGSDTVAVLPPAARPSHYLYLPIYTNDGGEGSAEIAPSGEVYVWGTGATQFSSLAGLSFPVTLTSGKLTLQNGWVPASGTGSPRVAVSGGIVYLSGSTWRASGTAKIFTMLPKAARPRHNLWLPVYTSGGTEGTLEITTAGAVSASGLSAPAFTSLAGIHFPLGS